MVNERLREAHADGDFESNPAFYDAIEEQMLLERRIDVLEAQLPAARVVAPASNGRVGIGSFVSVRELEVVTWRSTSSSARSSRTSATDACRSKPRSAARFSGRSEGEIVEVETPR